MLLRLRLAGGSDRAADRVVTPHCRAGCWPSGARAASGPAGSAARRRLAAPSPPGLRRPGGLPVPRTEPGNDLGRPLECVLVT